GHACTVTCPNGEQPPAIRATVGAALAVASSGGMDGTIGQAVGKDVDDACESPGPSASQDDEFCNRYRAMLAWAAPHQGDVTQSVAGEVARRMREMRPYAPPQLLADVDLYIRVYGKFATAPEPEHIPIVGPEAAGIANAFRDM